LHPIPIGTSEDLVEGQTVYAIGNPFGLDHSLTKGIISALDRTMTSVTGQTIYGVIQTDPAINPGNSGGALLDSAGRLIGVNTAIKSATRSSAGIGFAVPVDTINHLVPQLIDYGTVTVPELGASYIEDRVTRGQFRIAGVMIERVQPESGADAAGLRGVRRLSSGNYAFGDIITAIDGKPITKLRDLEATLADYTPGAEVE
ncbi:MAG: trypsin-like peptidase domain-containing protein, partial [Planctomycetes bacterium]|nr:trypsin-like peptidase domain-containing protein [Planctomycetota bacterium]